MLKRQSIRYPLLIIFPFYLPVLNRFLGWSFLPRICQSILFIARYIENRTGLIPIVTCRQTEPDNLFNLQTKTLLKRVRWSTSLRGLRLRYTWTIWWSVGSRLVKRRPPLAPQRMSRFIHSELELIIGSVQAHLSLKIHSTSVRIKRSLCTPWDTFLFSLVWTRRGGERISIDYFERKRSADLKRPLRQTASMKSVPSSSLAKSN